MCVKFSCFMNIPFHTAYIHELMEIMRTNISPLRYTKTNKDTECIIFDEIKKVRN